MARMPTRFPSLDAEHKGAAPPAYRTLTNTASSDSWSVGSHDNKRKSWTGLVDSNENLNKYRSQMVLSQSINQSLSPLQTYFGSACQLGQVSAAPLARATNSSMSNMSDIVTFAMPKGALPVMADPVFIPAGSAGGSYPPSESLAPIPHADSRPEVPAPPKRNRLQEWKGRCNSKWSLCFFCFLALAIVGAIIAIVVTQALNMPKVMQMMWQAPPAYRGGQVAANNIDMNAEATPNRIRYQMRGAMPFKGNFIAYYDFTSGKAVIVDESLKKNGNQFACFVLPIDTSNTPSYEAMLKAAARAKSRIGQPEGWDEEWTMVPSPIDGAQAAALFNPPIPECAGARWIQLQTASGDQRNQKCNECHDFCLPEFGIQGQDNEGYLNIVRRNCFYLFVPEWRSYAQGNSAEQNQRDFEAFYRNKAAQQNGVSGANGAGSKWIPLAGMQPPSQPYGPSSPGSIPAPGVQPQQGQMLPAQQGMQQVQQQNGHNMGMQPYGINQQTQQGQLQQLQQQPSSFQPYGVQPGQQQQQPSNGMGTANGGSPYVNGGVSGLPQQIANAGQSAINTIGNAVTDVGQGVSGLYSNLQNQSIAGVVSMPTGGTGSSIGVGGYGQRLLGYGSGGTSGVVASANGGVDWQGQQQSQQTTYPGGFVPDGLRSTSLEAGIPGVANPQYYQNGNGQQQQSSRMGDLTGYAPNVVSTQQGLQQIGPNGSTDPRQMSGVIGMSPSSGPTPPPSTGYVPDVMQQQPQQQLQQSIPTNQFYGRGR
ncbi:hypothetical protein PFISCL1PPCAC_544 [Pristionchus fissidentatus]|uniref:Pqn-73 n=1 Tax=Pristionchus fissidentatus TaxID=1538716 RepID=A0AAV5UQ57_9BILA|nr:hypothetical protein PFISCL1PPCAC_544 [Pristionchus fissidentatus]